MYIYIYQKLVFIYYYCTLTRNQLLNSLSKLNKSFDHTYVSLFVLFYCRRPSKLFVIFFLRTTINSLFFLLMKVKKVPLSWLSHPGFPAFQAFPGRPWAGAIAPIYITYRLVKLKLSIIVRI